MELSLFLAKLFGIYLLAMGLLWAARGEVIAGVLEEFLTSPPALFVSGLIALWVGIAMAIGHSVWEPNWRGLITLMGYLSIVKGVMRIGFPDVPRKAALKMIRGTSSYFWVGLALALGGYLTWAGFTQG